MLSRFSRSRLAIAVLLSSAATELQAEVPSDIPAAILLAQDVALPGGEPAIIAEDSPLSDEAPLSEIAEIHNGPIASSASPACSFPSDAGSRQTTAAEIQKKREAAASKAAQAYKGVFYDNDFSYLRDPWYDGFYPGEGLKLLPMPRGGEIDLGGELRLRYHSEHNIRGQGLTGRDDDFLLTRVRLFSNYRINDYFRFYGEYLYAESGGETFASRPIEVNRGEAQNLFLDAHLISEQDHSLTARAGRQELIYGNQRLVSPLDWANTRRTFDGYKLMYSGPNWNVDGFFVNPVDRAVATQGTNRWDGADTQTLFYGVYGTRKDLDLGQFDTYYLGLDYERAGASVHTLGSRLAGSYDWLLYEFEAGVQFGDNADGTRHDAGFFTAGFGKKLDLNLVGKSWAPTIWTWYDYASGEDDFAQAGRFGDGFDHLFPLAHKYNGFMDLFGRRNLHDLNAQFITPIFGERVSLLLWYHYFLLDNLTTPYSVTMVPFNTVAPAADRELGHELDVLFTINLNPRNSMLVGYSYFHAGDYYDETSGGLAGNNGIPSLDDAHFFYLQYQLQF